MSKLEFDGRNPLLIFLDEVIGFRKSLHHLHRWFETGNVEELEQLVIEVGREHSVDMWPILNAIKSGNDAEGLMPIHLQLQKGMYLPYKWTEAATATQLTPLNGNPFYQDINSLEVSTAKIWQFRDWVDSNLELTGINPIGCIAMAQQLLIDARIDFLKVFELMEMMFGYNTLASCVLRGSLDLFGDVVSTYYPAQSAYIKNLVIALQANTELNWKDALSRNQVRSKIWLIDQISSFPEYNKKRKLGEEPVTTIVVGGWVGLLPFLAYMKGVNLHNVINVDTDTPVHAAAYTLNGGLYPSFKNSSSDVRQFPFNKYKNLVVIDTIVEHFENHGEWIKTLPSGTTVVLQGNDMFDVPDHVNCHNSLEEFVGSCGLNTITWQGELLLYKCTRYMAIGKV